MPEDINDGKVLNHVKEELAFFASKKDIIDNMGNEQVNELDNVIFESGNKESITWND